MITAWAADAEVLRFCNRVIWVSAEANGLWPSEVLGRAKCGLVPVARHIAGHVIRRHVWELGASSAPAGRIGMGLTPPPGARPLSWPKIAYVLHVDHSTFVCCRDPERLKRGPARATLADVEDLICWEFWRRRPHDESGLAAEQAYVAQREAV